MIRNCNINVKLGVVGLTAIATLVLAGCGGGGGTVAPTSSLVTGVASKGPLNGSTVCAFAITGGVKGASLGACAAGIVNGKYSINLGSYTGPVLFEATGGTYVDEATGATVALAAPLHSMLGGTTGGNTTAAITPLTELAYQDAISIASGMTAARISAAIAKVQTFFGVADIVKTLPVDALAPPATATAAEKTYALALASVSEYLKAQPAGTTLPNALTRMGACLAAPATGCGTGATAVDASLTAAKATFLAGHPGLGVAAAVPGGAGAVPGGAGAAPGGAGAAPGGAGAAIGTGLYTGVLAADNSAFLSLLNTACTTKMAIAGGTAYSNCTQPAMAGFASNLTANMWMGGLPHQTGGLVVRGPSAYAPGTAKVTALTGTMAGVAVGDSCSVGIAEPYIPIVPVEAKGVRYYAAGVNFNFNGTADDAIVVTSGGVVLQYTMTDKVGDLIEVHPNLLLFGATAGTEAIVGKVGFANNFICK